MDAYENLARNLRRLCREKGSITKVCDDTKINRQQFSRYLSGQTIPRREILKKICDYFGVSSVELFMGKERGSQIDIDSTLLQNEEFLEVIEQVEAAQPKPMQDGYYMTYFRPASRKDWIIRSLIIVQSVDSVTAFRRLTGYGERYNSAWRMSMGHHRGVVLNRHGAVYFVGMDKKLSQVPSMIVTQWATTKMPILKGQAFALTPAGPELNHVVIEPMEETTLRKALRETNVLGFNESSLPKHVRHTFANM